MTAPRAQEIPAQDVVLVCAPAGYGKTMLLTELAHRSLAVGMSVAWVTCAREGDGSAFWAALLTSMTRASGAETSALGALYPPQGVVGPDFVSALLRVLEDQEDDLLLVVDDVHELRDRDTLEGLRRLLEEAPEGMTIALGGRFEPAMGLHRLRLEGRLREVRAEDLSFTADEAREFWALYDTPLGDAEQASLLGLTEGWPAGMRMAALSLERVADPREFVEDFGADDRSVADYLASEVLTRLPADTVDFLRDTSIVEEVSADLATSLSGRADAFAVLDDLAQRNAFVIRMGRSGEWFRLHALLRSHLAADRRRRDRTAHLRLHGSAARWFLDNGRVADGLAHAVEAHDARLVAEVMLSEGLGMLLAGSDSVLRHVLADPPRDLIAAPVILVHRALAALDDGDLLAADEALADLARVQDDGADARLTSLRWLASLRRSRLAGHHTTSVANPLLARDEGPSGADPSPGQDQDVRLAVLAERGMVRLFVGDYEAATEDLQRAARLARSQRLPHLAFTCLNLLPGAFVARNLHHQALAAARDAWAFAEARGWAGSPRLAYALMSGAWCSFLLLRPEEAHRSASRAVEVIGASTDVDVEVIGVVRTGAAIITFEDATRRREALDRLAEVTGWLAERSASPALVAVAAAHELRMCLAVGEWRRAEEAVTRAGERIPELADLTVLQAQYAFARGRAGDAQRMLQPILAGQQGPIRTTAVTTAWLMEAMICRRTGREPAATAALLSALDTAAPTGAGRPFLDAGDEVQTMLIALRGRAGSSEAFLGDVLDGIAAVRGWQRRHADRPDAAAAGSGDGVWLTERELSVLRELPSLMTLGEVAMAQGVSTNTVKSHVRSIYAKFQVSSRREAINTARRRGLL